MSEARICEGCGNELLKYVNYCSWDCHIAAARKVGGREVLPNGLPVRCITRDGTMLECEDGDHPDYKFPVEAGRRNFVERDDERELLETHAFIYTDGQMALTIYETGYFMWALRDGSIIHMPSWGRGNMLLKSDSLEKIRAFAAARVAVLQSGEEKP